MMNPRHHWMVTAAVLSSVMVRTMILLGTVQMMFHNSDNSICVNAFTQIASPQSQQLRLNTFPRIYPSASLSHDPTQIASRWTLSSSSSMHHNSHHHQHQQPKGHSFLVRTIQNVVTTVSTVSRRKFTALQQALLSIRSVLLRLQLLPRQRIRHSILVFVTSFLLIWNIGSLGLSSSLSSPFPFLTTPVAHAASSTSTITASTALTERMLDRISNSDVDKIIHQYVQKHMFDDDLSASDPIVGTYREAHYDHTLPQKYPMMLRNIITETFRGTKLLDPSSSSSLLSASNVAKPPPLDVGLLLTRTVQLLQKTLGLTELTATIVLAITFVVAGPSVFLLFGMIVGGISKRNMDQIFKKRYGETYTVDATIKQEPVIELPSEDDDDDDDDDDDSDDNGDDEDDDNETKGSNKNKKK